MNNGKITSWKSVGGAAAQGAITGAVAGLTGEASLIASAAVSAGANVIGGEVNRRIQGKHTTVGDVVSDAAIGGAFGAGGYVSGKFVRKGLNQVSNSTKGRVGELTTKVKYATKGYRSKGNAIVPTGKRTPTGRVQAAHYDHDMKNVFTGRHIVVESKFNTSKLTINQRNAQKNIGIPFRIDRTTGSQLGNWMQQSVNGSAGIIGNNNRR